MTPVSAVMHMTTYAHMGRMLSGRTARQTVRVVQG